MAGTTTVDEPAIARTDAPVPAERLQRDVARVLDAVYDGAVAIIPLDVAYAIIGHRPEAIRSIFDAKQRSYEKPSGMFGTWRMSRDIHLLPDDKHEMVRTIIEEERLPFSVVAPFRADHPVFAKVDPFVLESSTKAGTLDMLLNAGIFHDEVARQSYERLAPIFGSSANTSLKGSKYRLEDVEAQVREAAAIEVDYGLSKYANDEGRSSTIIDFRDFSVVRVGVCFDRLQAAFKTRFGVTLEQPR
ncbi:MAG: Sua5/YciO/YrdC/YwlC family protein [Kiloniellales bacterium]|nr:Sua5/YciO/YrdC/YwlC family protein [Kiloniellales bacterium]